MNQGSNGGLIEVIFLFAAHQAVQVILKLFAHRAAVPQHHFNLPIGQILRQLVVNPRRNECV